jgi:hypothetical protein
MGEDIFLKEILPKKCFCTAVLPKDSSLTVLAFMTYHAPPIFSTTWRFFNGSTQKTGAL